MSRLAQGLASGALFLVALCACASGPQLRERSRVVQADIDAARALNAETCAPRELAIAEGNLRFAGLELDQGDSSRAEDHLNLAAPNARRALAQSKDCARLAARVREKEAGQAPPVALKDTDGDGVPDVDDLCPEVPGPASNHGCPVTNDRDGDGVPDDIDRCPDVPGPRENFGCPWPDRDGDGVPDKDDKCPDVPGPKENFGCPFGDRDGDGVPDDKDRCPDVPGPAENAGCPWPDRDHDGVPDKDDRCPDEPGPADNFGCPRKQSLVVVRKDRIELKQQVRFKPNRSVILSDSFELLRQVARALRDAPGVHIRIEGHTDNVGKLRKNMKLSQARADAVRDFLVRQGVDSRQIASEGYGPTRPIASNQTRAGKAANRRVEFRMSDEAPSR